MIEEQENNKTEEEIKESEVMKEEPKIISLNETISVKPLKESEKID